MLVCSTNVWYKQISKAVLFEGVVVCVEAQITTGFIYKISTAVGLILAHQSLKEMSLQATSTNKIYKVQRRPIPSVPI